MLFEVIALSVYFGCVLGASDINFRLKPFKNEKHPVFYEMLFLMTSPIALPMLFSDLYVKYSKRIRIDEKEELQ